MRSKDVVLGYEIGTGAPVSIPLHHVVVTGMTQLSGKTTTLEALITRSGLKAIAFRTKRGESGFDGAAVPVHPHRPYFLERADWQYVQGLLEATMRERMKFERSWIIKVCKGAKTLRDVQARIEEELARAKGLSESVYTNLKAYLEIVVPEIEKAELTNELRLGDGVNVMDVTGMRDEVQALVIASTIERVYEKEKDVVIVVPEAWKFCPEGRGSPVKRVAEKVIRQGASVGIYLWFDSQDIAGVDKALLKQVDTWILGRQRELNEVQHTLEQLPLSRAQRPRPEEIMHLQVGHFFACFDDVVKKVYVQPAWLSWNRAREIAVGSIKVEAAGRPPSKDGDEMYEEELKVAVQKISHLEADKTRLEKEVSELEEVVKVYASHYGVRLVDEVEETETPEEVRRTIDEGCKHGPKVPRSHNIATMQPQNSHNVATAEIVDAVIAELETRQPALLKVLLERPELQVAVDRPIVKTDDGTIRGRLAILIHEGFFGTPRPAREILSEVLAKGWGDWSGGGNNPRMYQELKWLQLAGFLRKEGGAWTALPGIEKRIKEG